MENHNFKKKFGQNFLTDTNLLSAIVRDAGVDSQDCVVEIGMGQGALTEQLSNKAKRVYGFEIDLELKDFLEKKFKNSNVVLFFEDILSYDITKLESQISGDYKVVANIPYYITTPIIFYFLEKSNTKSLCLMVQKEVAEKIVAKYKTKNYGVLSVICQSFCECKIKRIVSKKLFTPSPKVDSAIISLIIKQKFDFEYSKFVRSCFSMRRKTLANNISSNYGLTKTQIEEILKSNDYNVSIRAEELDVDNFKKLFEVFRQNLRK